MTNPYGRLDRAEYEFFETLGVVGDGVWDDEKFPLIGQNIDQTSGRLGFDFFNGTVTFANNARYAESETVSFTFQLSHAWKEGTNISPHIHWLQQHATNIPNWLLGYEIRKKNTTKVALNTDFSNHTLLLPEAGVFTYSSGILEQITPFPDIDLTGCEISDIIHFCLWRDSLNTSGLFAGADPSNITEHVREFDVHALKDSAGSIPEFTKQTATDVDDPGA